MEKYDFDDYTFVYELFKYIYQEMILKDLELEYKNIIPFINFNSMNKIDFPKVELFWGIFLDLVNDNKILRYDTDNSLDISILETAISEINNGADEPIEVDNINSLELYSFFVDTVIYFGFDDILPEFKNFISEESYSNVTNNEYLKELFEIFKMVNYINTFYTHDYTKLKTRLWNEFNRFNYYIKEYNTFLETYKKIKSIPLINNELFIVNLSEDKLKNLLIKNDILKVKDLKQLSLKSLRQLFKNNEMLNELDAVLSNLSMSLKEKIEIYASDYFRKKLKNNEFTVLKYRSQKYTLEFIGDKLGVTRERIRQIEAKARRKVSGFISDVNGILSGLDLDRNFITVNTLKNYLDEYTDIYLSLTNNKYENSNLIGLSTDSESYYYFFSKIIRKQNDYYHKEDVFDLLNILLNNSNFYISLENLIEIFEAIYTKTGLYYFKGKQNLTDKYLIILKYHFNVSQEINLDMIDSFKDKYYEIFEEEEIFEKDGRAILTRLIESPEVFLVERGTYKILSKDTIDLGETLYRDIYSFIKKRENVLTEYLFKIFKDRLIPVVNNKYELHGRLKDKFPDLYFAKDTIGLNKNPVVDVEAILARYIDERNGRFDLDDLLIDLPMLSGRDMGQYLTLNEEYLAMFNRKFIHKDYFHIENDEIEMLIKEIKNVFSFQDVINGQIILNLMREFTPDLIIRNNVNSNVYAFHIFRVFLNTNHTLSYPDILKFGIDTDNKISFYERNKFIIDRIETKNQFG